MCYLVRMCKHLFTIQKLKQNFLIKLQLYHFENYIFWPLHLFSWQGHISKLSMGPLPVPFSYCTSAHRACPVVKQCLTTPRHFVPTPEKVAIAPHTKPTRGIAPPPPPPPRHYMILLLQLVLYITLVRAL